MVINSNASLSPLVKVSFVAHAKMVNGSVRNGNVLLSVVLGGIPTTKRLMGNILIIKGSVIMFFRKVSSVLKIRSVLLCRAFHVVLWELPVRNR